MDTIEWTLLVYGDKSYAVVNFGGQNRYQRLVDADGIPDMDGAFWRPSMKQADEMFTSRMNEAAREFHRGAR